MKGTTLACLCVLPLALAPSAAAQKSAPDESLHRAAAKRYREIESKLRRSARPKLESAAREVRIFLIRNPKEVGFTRLATVAVRKRFAGLSEDQETLLDLGLLARLDEMSELGETESLRLQMAMDRRSKFMIASGNILKKASETDVAIVQNLR